MKRPIVAANQPVKVEFKAGQSYFYCRCGLSAQQPFCDGSHKGSGIAPLRFDAQHSGEVWLCACKQSADQPFCDGSHKQISDELVGRSATREDA